MHAYTSANAVPGRCTRLLACIAFAFSHPTASHADAWPQFETPQAATSGTLFFPGPDGTGYVAAPVVESDVELRIAGMICRATVRQRFQNPTDAWVEGLYVFPLPQMAAVDAMELVVGDRVIEGRIQEREQARRIYAAARASGTKASLVEQHRPNIFSTQIANLGPGEEARVTIRYQQTLQFDSGGFRLRFPMLVAPRYTPAAAGDAVPAEAPAPLTLAAFAEILHGRRAAPGWLADGLERVGALPPAAIRAARAPTDSDQRSAHRVRLRVSLDAGFAIESLSSPSHAFRFEAPSRNRRELESFAQADRDFVLQWRLARGEQPRAAIFAEEADDSASVLLMLLPPDEAFGRRAIAREVVFAIDTSGSMGGASIRQARDALQWALGRLDPGDRFNVIAFDSAPRPLFEASRPAGPDDVARARSFVASLVADGGTEMQPALEMALDSGRGEAPPGGVRQVVFMTDGSIGNETALFETVRRRLGSSRLFAVGIGSAPNGYLLERIARFGRGTYTFIASPGEVAERITGLFEKLERPSLSDIELHWNDAIEMWPDRVPDLYAGEPLIVTARVPRFVGDVLVSGRIGERPWEARLALRPDAHGSGIGKLWARAKIAALMDSVSDGADRAAVREAVTAVALQHHLVSKFTSLVAVDVSPSRPVSEPLARGRVPLPTPRGWKSERTVEGALPRAATPARLLLWIGLGSLAGAWAQARRA